MNFFESIEVKKKEIVPEIIQINKININVFKFKLPKSWSMVAAEPVRILWRVYSEIKEKPIIRVFVAPSKIKNPRLSVFIIVLPIAAAWPLPRPGRKPQRGEAIIVAINGLKNFGSGFEKVCLGIFILVFILKIIEEAPKRPERRGSNGSFISNSKLVVLSGFRTRIPKIPVIKATCSAENFFLSEKIIIKTIIIKMYGRKFLIEL